mgnify:CR=1 FL=1|jgi:hypothetical protein
MSSVWETLSAIDCSKHVEKKGKLSYLSWTWAWQILNEHYPDSTYEYYEPTFLEDGTAEVSVALTVEGKTHKMWLPVMDNRNASIPKPSSFDVNKARMRCLTKAIAFFGLGIYIYAGEDLPQAVQTAVVSEDQAAEIKALLAEHSVDVKVFLQHFKTSSVDEMLAVHYSKAVSALKAKANK